MPDELAFDCQTCGERHTGLPAWHFGAPAAAGDVPPDEHSTRLDLTADGCVIDESQFFLKGLLEIPVRYSASAFIWGVWVEINRTDFEQYGELFGDALRPAGREFVGRVANSLPEYPETRGLEVALRVREYPMRPVVVVKAIGHPLYSDAIDGISHERAVRTAKSLAHGEPG